MRRLARCAVALLALSPASSCGARTGLDDPDHEGARDAGFGRDAAVGTDAAVALDASVEPLGCDGRPLPRPGSVTTIDMPARMRAVGVLIPDPLGVIVVGGQTSPGEAADQMVFLDLVGNRSQELPVEGDPVVLPDREATAVYMPGLERVAVVGGNDASGGRMYQVFSFMGLGDVGGIRRVHVFEQDPFFERSGHAATWDPIAGRVVLHGGSGQEARTTYDVRVYDDHSDYEPILDAGASPPAGVRAMGYDPVRNRAIEISENEEGPGLIVYALELAEGAELWRDLGDIDFSPSTRGELIYDPSVCGFHLLSARRTRCILEHWILVVGDDDVEVVYRGELELAPPPFLAASTFVPALNALVVYGSEDCDREAPVPSLVAHEIALVR